jgi:sugar-specific transcriptional regulator TrmB
MIADLLQNFGLSPEVASTYAELIQRGPLSAQQLSDRLGLPRTTIYGYLSELLQRGLVSREENSSRSVFAPLNPGKLLGVIEDTRATLRTQEDGFAKIIREFENSRGGDLPQYPIIQHYRGKKQIEQMLYALQPEWRRSYERLGMFTMWGYQDHTFVEQYSRWHTHAWQTRSSDEEIRLFSNREGASQQKNAKIERREIRVLPNNAELTTSLWIHGDYIVLAMTRSKPHYAVVVVDPILSANMRLVFQLLWAATATPRSSRKKRKT